MGVRTASWRCLLAILVLGLALAPVAPAQAAPQDAAGRVYTLTAQRGLWSSASLTVAGDGSIYVVDGRDGDGEAYRLAPGDTRLRRVARGRSYADVAPSTDGAVLLSDPFERSVWRLQPDGALSRVAGRAGGEEGAGELSGDGGPATAAGLCAPSQLTALPDGGFAFSDGSVVRRVGADGVISTMASTVTPPACAWREGMAPIVDLAATPAGGLDLLLGAPADAHPRVVSVPPAGGWKTLVAGRSVDAIAVDREGALLTAEYHGIVRRPPGSGRAEEVIGESFDDALFDGDGDRAASYDASSLAAVAAAPDGGILALGESLNRTKGTRPTRVLYLAPAAPTRLAVALRAQEGRATGRAYAASFLATQAGSAVVSIRDARGRVIATARAAAGPGRTAISVPHRLSPGVFTVSIVVTSPDGRRAADAARLVLGGVLTSRVAKAALRPSDFCGSNCERTITSVASRRFGPRRVDWRFRVRDDLGASCETGSALLTPRGTVRVRSYTCPRRGRPMFPARPRYRHEGHEVAPTQPPDGG